MIFFFFFLISELINIGYVKKKNKKKKNSETCIRFNKLKRIPRKVTYINEYANKRLELVKHEINFYPKNVKSKTKITVSID